MKGWFESNLGKYLFADMFDLAEIQEWKVPNPNQTPPVVTTTNKEQKHSKKIGEQKRHD